MTIIVDQVETSGKGTHMVQITVWLGDPERDFPSVRVRLPMREDEIGTLSLHDIHDRALRKVPDLLRSVSSTIDEGFRPSPAG